MRRDSLGAWALSVLWPAVFAATARAADPHAAAAGGDDIFGKALDLAIWTIVVFLLLLFILSKYAWKPMLEGLQRREENIRAAVEEARLAREEAQRLRAELQTEINKAQEKVRDFMDEARRDAKQLADDMAARAKEEIQTERQRLRREIETARDQALHELWNQTAQLASLVSSKAIRRNLTPDDHRRLVDEALAELRDATRKSPRELANT
jgi:F-type H+-transporting ATPase subunit b